MTSTKKEFVMANRIIKAESLFLLGMMTVMAMVDVCCAFTTTNTLQVSHHHRTTQIYSGVPGADIEQETGEVSQSGVPSQTLARGKLNEIDFCIAPADVSLSRAYAQSPSDAKLGDQPQAVASSPESLSLTRALNNASNRAVRRILLARCWPSAEALNLSLRMVAIAEMQAREKMKQAGDTVALKCPVPRPILNILMRNNAQNQPERKPKSVKPRPRSRTDAEYVADQLKSFREKYGDLPGYEYAEAYLDVVLGLATTGKESPRVKEVLESKIYDESYRRIVAVLKSVGAKFEKDPETGHLQITERLDDQDICLSMLDKMNVNNVLLPDVVTEPETSAEVEQSKAVEEPQQEEELAQTVVIATDNDAETKGKKRAWKQKLQFWKKAKGTQESEPETATAVVEEVVAEVEPVQVIKSNDLGGVILSAEEPTMTKQLNALSNIVKRALLFGGDEELLVLSETLDANKVPFIARWYPQYVDRPESETRPGVQFLNALIKLLRECYDEGVVTTLDPLVEISQRYSNAYERLMASLVELGSGYVRPATKPILAMPKPRTPTEEFGRFAVWESYFRQQNGEDGSSYPVDLEGSWRVEDEVSGEIIGVSTVVFDSQGKVNVASPMEGLRWRLDPGPTHLDTCTFQVLGVDGMILQYRGFIDRGARLEARFSKRPIRIRGSVMFQMRDGETTTGTDGYWKDILPVNYKTGTTKFVMTKKNSDSDS